MGAAIGPISTISGNQCRILVSTPNEMTQWRVNTFWDKEPNTLRWIETFRPDEIFLDVGANIGLYSLYAALTRGVEVLAFEPESQNYALLNKNIFLNQLDGKIKAYPFALSDETAFAPFHVSLFMEGAACHSLKEKPPEADFSQGCFSLTLDFLIQKKLIEVPHHIKIDVDGIEPKIINGAKKLLKNRSLRSILVELNTNLPSHRRLIPLLQKEGFTYTQVDPGKGDFEGVANYIFYRAPESEWERHFSFASKIP